MPHSSKFNQINPNQAVAICTREQAEQMVIYNNHTVIILGRTGLLLTDEWTPIEEHIGPFVLTVVFHHTESHPPAPNDIQAIVDKLSFQIRGQPR
jgi:hypothetical protein